MNQEGAPEKRYRKVGGVIVMIAVLAALAGGSVMAGARGDAGETDEPKRPRCSGTVDECVEYMTRKMKSSGWIGVELAIDERTGVFTIEHVLPDSPAAAAKLRKGDILTAINGRPILEYREKMMAGDSDCSKPGQLVTYSIRRDGAERDIRLVIAPMPAEVLARYIGQHLLEHEEYAGPEPADQEDHQEPQE